LTFTSEIDLTGIATVVLALATAWLAKATHESVDQSSIEVERAHRPVLVPIVDRSQSFRTWGGYDSPLTPRLRSRRLHVPIRNVGMGPALYVEATAEFGDRQGFPSSSGIYSLTGVRPTPGISADTPWVIVEIPNTTVSEMTGFVLRLTYGDVAGKQWETTARYSLDADVFEDVRIAALD
jgi:hypothetical protein